MAARLEYDGHTYPIAGGSKGAADLRVTVMKLLRANGGVLEVNLDGGGVATVTVSGYIPLAIISDADEASSE